MALTPGLGRVAPIFLFFLLSGCGTKGNHGPSPGGIDDVGQPHAFRAEVSRGADLPILLLTLDGPGVFDVPDLGQVPAYVLRWQERDDPPDVQTWFLDGNLTVLGQTSACIPNSREAVCDVREVTSWSERGQPAPFGVGLLLRARTGHELFDYSGNPPVPLNVTVADLGDGATSVRLNRPGTEQFYWEYSGEYVYSANNSMVPHSAAWFEVTRYDEGSALPTIPAAPPPEWRTGDVALGHLTFPGFDQDPLGIGVTFAQVLADIQGSDAAVAMAWDKSCLMHVVIERGGTGQELVGPVVVESTNRDYAKMRFITADGSVRGFAVTYETIQPVVGEGTSTTTVEEFAGGTALFSCSREEQGAAPPRDASDWLSWFNATGLPHSEIFGLTILPGGVIDAVKSEATGYMLVSIQFVYDGGAACGIGCKLPSEVYYDPMQNRAVAMNDRPENRAYVS